MTTHPCTTARHEITRTWQAVKDGAVECDCICWTCSDKVSPAASDGGYCHSWTEVYRVEKVADE